MVKCFGSLLSKLSLVPEDATDEALTKMGAQIQKWKPIIISNFGEAREQGSHTHMSCFVNCTKHFAVLLMKAAKETMFTTNMTILTPPNGGDIV